MFEEPSAPDDGEEPNLNDQALTPSPLASPAKVTEQLTGPNSQPMVHIPLPGWVWNLTRRKQWREALNHWREIDNLVILVELPPASVPEAVLLGSNLPNMLWLAHSGQPHAGETRAQLETMRNARCNLIGAVLNREPGPTLKSRFPRWLGCLSILPLALAHNLAPAQPPAPPLAHNLALALAQSPAPAPNSVAADDLIETNGSFSISNPSQRAGWQKHFTLGPGDVLNFSLYGQPELARTEVAVGPDGRVSYLEAQDVMASGLTVDELRERMDQELAKYRRSPRTMVTPTAFRSKRYYMLGKVATKGIYVLDRPITVLEAVARAHGLETGLVDRDLVELTDFQHSFLARGGKRYPLNFERLFQQGDLSQNIPVEPGDYIYFAPGDVRQVYVVGEVRLPGPVTYTPDLTIISAIAQRAGYTDRAFKARVIVVRGSLSNPETFAVNTHAILDAKEPDFRIRPRDIIYVNSRPFIKVEEALDLAATAFIQSLIASWVGVDVVHPFTQ
jgi:protein involved in polysaccharide export with SLBB domain